MANGIWLCQSCAKLIDADTAKFPVALLRQWKSDAERAASDELSVPRVYREILPTEVQAELSRAEFLGIRALEEELGCRLAVQLRVETSDGGWLRLDAAAVRGRTLVGVDLHEFDGGGIRFFQIEHLVELVRNLEFLRFDGFELWLVVVSTGGQEPDEDMSSRFRDIAENAGFPVEIRLHRLPLLERQLA